MNKLIEKLSWLKNRIQKDLFPHLAECFNDPITEWSREAAIREYLTRNRGKNRNALDLSNVLEYKGVC